MQSISGCLAGDTGTTIDMPPGWGGRIQQGCVKLFLHGIGWSTYNIKHTMTIS